MFRVLDIEPGGRIVESTDAARVAPPPPGVVRWIDLQAQDAEHLALLGERFGFHPLAIEDCTHFDQRPKVESYGDHLFLVTHGFRLPAAATDDSADVELLELHAFLGERYLVTVHDLPLEPLEHVWKRMQSDPTAAQRGVDFIYYLVCDGLVDALFPLLDELAERVEQIEDQVLAQSRDDCLPEIFQLKRILVTLRRVLSPQRDLFALLAKRGEAGIGEATAVYFRDIYDHLLRIHETVEATRDLLGNALDAYLWSASQRTNEIMKRLTLLSAVFLPLAFITGFFGQNFDDLPYDFRPLMWGMLASCVAVPAAMMYFFLRSKWF